MRREGFLRGGSGATFVVAPKRGSFANRQYILGVPVLSSMDRFGCLFVLYWLIVRKKY